MINEQYTPAGFDEDFGHDEEPETTDADRERWAALVDEEAEF